MLVLTHRTQLNAMQCTAGRLASLPAWKLASKCWCSHTARNSKQCTAGRLASLPARKLASKCWCSHTARNSMQCNARQAGLPRCLPGSWPQNVGAHTLHGIQCNARQAGLPRCLRALLEAERFRRPQKVGVHVLTYYMELNLRGKQACFGACKCCC